jgi:hypothetical protein
MKSTPKKKIYTMMFEEITADPGANLTISVISAKSDYI